ncbi:biotin/lipoyl-containing protein [Planctomicrobium sp. SH661]|uniref:biotin/lipoyl-containing protein n=1 Tax=Planctomicrobium sp. SH661 TaxID=3448124 RepID=UPI003F5CA6DC
MKQDAFSQSQFDVVCPDPGTGCDPILLINWLVPVASNVIPGERLAELLTGGVLLHLEALYEGVLVEQSIPPGTQVHPGDVLGRIRSPG